MKKLLCLLLTLVLCLGILAGCGGEEYDLEGAKTFLYETYKTTQAKATNDYDIAAKVVVNSITYEVTWASSNAAVTFKDSNKNGFVTVDIPEYNETETTYTLTATIKAPDGTTITLELERTLPVFDNREIVDASSLKENTAYKMFLEQKTLGQALYALATTQNNENKFINTTADATQAPDFYVEIVDGGYKFYTTVDGTKTYVYAKTVASDDGKISKYVGYSTTEATVWEYDDIGVFKTQIDGEYYGFGTYSSYKTMCISEWRHFTADAVNNTQFVTKFIEKEVAENKTPDAEKPIETLANAVEPTVGNKYNLAMVHGGKDNATYYLTGAMNGYYASLSTAVADAANFYVEAVEGGFNVYGIIAGERLYVNMVKSGTHTNIKFEATASTVYTYDATLKTLKADVEGTAFVFGTAAGNTYETVGPVKAADKNYYLQFVVSTNADQTAPETPDGPGSSTPDEPTPELPATGVIFDLGANGTAAHDDGQPASGTLTFTAGGYELVLTDLEKVYSGAFDAKGNSAIKLGTGSVAATFTFTVPADVNSVTIYAACYKNYADNCTIVINDTTYTLTAFSNDGEYEAITVDTTTTKTVTVETAGTKPRAMINTIVFGGVTGSETPENPGENPGETPSEPETPDTPAEPETPDEPTVPTYNTVTELHNGDVVIIGAPAYNMALSTIKVSTYYNKGVSYADGFDAITDDELFVVTVNADGSYTFTSKTGIVIALAAANSSLNAEGQNTTWTLTAKEGATGLFYVRNVGRQNYLEWYASKNNWSSYNTSNLDGQFEIAFYLVEAGEGGSGSTTPETPAPETPVEPETPETPAEPETPATGATGSVDFNTIVTDQASGGYSSYDKTFTTTNGWTTVNAAIQAGGSSDMNPQFKVIGTDNTTKAVCLNGKTSAVGKLTSPTLTGGISKINLTYTKMFTDTALSFTITVTDLATGATQTKVVERTVDKNNDKYVVWDVEWVLDTAITGDFTIEIVNNCPSATDGNKDRVTILTLTWVGKEQ